MPLSRKKDRERKRQSRLESKDVQPKVILPGLVIEGNKIIGVQPKSNLNTEERVNIPIYNPAIHRPGDRVRIKSQYSKRLIEIVIPEMDAGGCPMPEYT